MTLGGLSIAFYTPNKQPIFSDLLDKSSLRRFETDLRTPLRRLCSSPLSSSETEHDRRPRNAILPA